MLERSPAASFSNPFLTGRPPSPPQQQQSVPARLPERPLLNPQQQGQVPPKQQQQRPRQEAAPEETPRPQWEADPSEPVLVSPAAPPPGEEPRGSVAQYTPVRPSKLEWLEAAAAEDSNVSSLVMTPKTPRPPSGRGERPPHSCLAVEGAELEWSGFDHGPYSTPCAPLLPCVRSLDFDLGACLIGPVPLARPAGGAQRPRGTETEARGRASRKSSLVAVLGVDTGSLGAARLLGAAGSPSPSRPVGPPSRYTAAAASATPQVGRWVQGAISPGHAADGQKRPGSARPGNDTVVIPFGTVA